MDVIRFGFLAAAVLTLSSVASAASPTVVPAVKLFLPTAGEVELKAVSIAPVEEQIRGEVEFLTAALAERNVAVTNDGVPVRMVLQQTIHMDFEPPYGREIAQQSYWLGIGIDPEDITIKAATPAGIHYGIQTLLQMITDDQTVPAGVVDDWPDFARRMIMVDMARANENMDYYRRVIEFCDRYKINYVHLHLTDDENAALYHESYPSLMSPHPWRKEDLRELVAFAERRHITLVPEVESLGHSRLFVRHPDFKDILHQTTDKTPKASWAGTQVPGYTNVLCPASEKTYDYLRLMYSAATVFPGVEIHIGLDEVDQTECARCQAKWPGISHVEWFIKHLKRCQELVDQHGRKMALWGDMILHHREIADALPTDRTLIYDWHYNPDMTDESVKFFKSKGFEIIACPALMCHPHMILPSDFNYVNIQRFAEIARQHNLLGLDITVWTPTRYMSDALWPGFAYAAAHAWSGSRWDEEQFYRGFVRDFFGSPKGEEFGRLWKDLYTVQWRLDRFNTSCWMDEATLTEAQGKAQAWGEEARTYRTRVLRIRDALASLRSTVQRNTEAWDAMTRSASVYAYVFDHFLAAPDVRRDGQWDRARLAELDKGCVEALTWIEANWDRNRFADDPNKDGRDMPNQNLLYRFRQMHRFHDQILKAEK